MAIIQKCVVEQINCTSLHWYYKGVDIAFPHRSIVVAALVAGCMLIAAFFGVAWVGQQDPMAGFALLSVETLSGSSIDAPITGMLRAADAKVLVKAEQRSGRILLTLAKKPRGHVRSLSSAFTTPPLFLFEAGDLSSLSVIGSLLGDTDPRLAEGFSGIGRSFLFDLTGHSDLRSAVEDLGAGPVSLAVTENGFAVTGTAASRGDLDVWIGRVNGQETEGQKRSLQFPGGEGTWIDIVAGTGGASNQISRSGRDFILATPDALLTSLIQARQTGTSSEEAAGGTFDIEWMTEKIRPFFPLLSATLKKADATGNGRVVWSVAPGADVWIIDWALAN